MRQNESSQEDWLRKLSHSACSSINSEEDILKHMFLDFVPDNICSLRYVKVEQSVQSTLINFPIFPYLPSIQLLNCKLESLALNLYRNRNIQLFRIGIYQILSLAFQSNTTQPKFSCNL